MNAGVAQSGERNPSKFEVASSILATRSNMMLLTVSEGRCFKYFSRARASWGLRLNVILTDSLSFAFFGGWPRGRGDFMAWFHIWLVGLAVLAILGL